MNNSQNYDFVEITEEDVFDMYPNAKELIAIIEKLLNH